MVRCFFIMKWIVWQAILFSSANPNRNTHTPPIQDLSPRPSQMGRELGASWL